MNLLQGEIIELRLVGACQMREDGLHADGFLMAQLVDQPRHVFLVKAQTVHTAVDLDMDGAVLQAFRFGSCHDGLERLMRIDVGFEVVLQNQIHRRHLRVHDDDGERDAGFAQLDTFISNRNRQIIDETALLERFADFNATGSVRERFDHTSQFGLGFEQAAEITDIIDECRQIDLHDGLVRLMKDAFGDGLFVVTQCAHDRRTGAYVLMSRVFDDGFGLREQFHFLFAFLLERSEVLVMFVTDIGDHADGRTDDAFQFLHLAGLTDTGFEDGDGRFLIGNW